MTNTESNGEDGPPRDPDAVIHAAFSNPELMQQLAASYEEELRGVPPVPFRQVQADARARDAAHKPTRRSA